MIRDKDGGTSEYTATVQVGRDRGEPLRAH